MRIALTCPHCGQKIRILAKHAGRQGKCPGCQRQVQVPQRLAAPQRASASPSPSPEAPVALAAPVAAPASRGLARNPFVVATALLLGTLGLLAFIFVGLGDRGPANSSEAPRPAAATPAANLDSGGAPGSASASQAPSAPGVPGDNNASLATAARGVLQAKCYRCHGESGSNEGGFNFVLRRDKLVSDSLLVPGDPDNSYLFQRMAQGQMPPAGESPALDASDLAAVRAWIAAGGADFNAPLQRGFIATAQTLGAIRNNLTATPPRDQRFQRYFTLTHLYNAGVSDDEMRTYEMALGKLLNSLSWNRRIVRPEPIDASRTVFRVDLRDLMWSDGVWTKIVRANSYSLIYESEDATAVTEITGCRLPFVRADWFVAAASKAPLYHDALQLPTTLKELQEKLLVDVALNIQRDRVARAGMSRSGVSQNNRLIERHNAPYGAMWISYDFAGNTGRKNLFEHPLGPGDNANSFQHDGGEIIFNLPNGLQGYMLVDAGGKRIDKGPTNIVSDLKRPDRAVVNGISCMSCHYAGIIIKDDAIRPHVEANRQSFPEADDILALYPTAGTMLRLQKADADRFLAAVQELGGGRITGTGEPVVNMALRFENNVDLKLAAAEFGMSPEELRSRLSANPSLARTLGPLNTPGGSVKRDVFAKTFGLAAETFGVAKRFDGQDVPAAAAQPGALAVANAAAPATANVVVPTLREWTLAQNGQKFLAAYAGFENSLVQLKTGADDLVQLPLERLSDADRQFVQGQQPPSEVPAPPPNVAAPPPSVVATPPNVTPPPADLPPPPTGAPSAGPNADVAGVRTWTPLSGAPQFAAKFVKLWDGKVVLKTRSGALVRKPLGTLCLSDLEYIEHRALKPLPSERPIEESGPRPFNRFQPVRIYDPCRRCYIRVWRLP